MSKPFNYGGQAVLEGVMMRGRRHMAVAVRHPSGEIIVHSEPLTSSVYTSPIARVPFVRGIAMLWEMLALGMRALMFSANVAVAEPDQVTTGKVQSEMPREIMWGMLGIGMTLAIGLFFVAPLALIGWLDRHIASSLVSNLVEGIIRLAVVLGYITAIGRLPDIKRVFAYHGAEHKAIHAHEAGRPLEVAEAQPFSTAHPRCGTGFLLTLVVVSVLVFSLIGRPPMWLRVISRIAFVPLIAAVTYEIIRLGAANLRYRLVRILFTPNLALQSLTTRPPDDSQVEVALVALKQVLAEDAAAVEVATPAAVPVVNMGAAETARKT